MAPVCLLFGDEVLLLEEACIELRRKAQEQGYTERVSFVAEAGLQLGRAFTVRQQYVPVC